MFEFSVYMNLITNTAMVAYVLAFNEIIGTYWKTPFTIFSYAFSCYYFLMLTILCFAPVAMFIFETDPEKKTNENTN